MSLRSGLGRRECFADAIRPFYFSSSSLPAAKHEKSARGRRRRTTTQVFFLELHRLDVRFSFFLFESRSFSCKLFEFAFLNSCFPYAPSLERETSLPFPVVCRRGMNICLTAIRPKAGRWMLLDPRCQSLVHRSRESATTSPLSFSSADAGFVAVTNLVMKKQQERKMKMPQCVSIILYC